MWIVETLDGSGIKRVIWVLCSDGPIGLPVNGNDPVVLGWDCERCSANPNGFGCCLGGKSNVSIGVVLRVRWLPRTMKRVAATLSPKVGA